MADRQIVEMSEQINKQELINYRNAVGCQTQMILRTLTLEDLKRKPQDQYLERLVSEGGLLEKKNSIWLKKFWGRHTVAGLILLPLTRHLRCIYLIVLKLNVILMKDSMTIGSMAITHLDRLKLLDSMTKRHARTILLLK